MLWVRVADVVIRMTGAVEYGVVAHEGAKSKPSSSRNGGGGGPEPRSASLRAASSQQPPSHNGSQLL